MTTEKLASQGADKYRTTLDRLAKEEKRDLAADLAICEAATPGPWIRRAEFDRAIAKEYTLDDVVSAEGDDMCHVVIEPSNERFIIEAREGWPHAIQRAMAAEAEADRVNHRNFEILRGLNFEQDRADVLEDKNRKIGKALANILGLIDSGYLTRTKMSAAVDAAIHDAKEALKIANEN